MFYIKFPGVTLKGQNLSLSALCSEQGVVLDIRTLRFVMQKFSVADGTV